jgi:hypothetical protein
MADEKPIVDDAEEPSESKESAGKSVDAKGEALASAMPPDRDELMAELEQLRVENAKLAEKHSSGNAWRSGGAGVLIVVGLLLFALAITAVWLNRTIMDEDRWVATVAPLAQNVAIQDYVANKAATAIFSAVDVQSYVEQALKPLPQQAQILAIPITSALQTVVREAANKFTHSEQFYTIWVEMNRIGHKAFIVAISDRQGGAITKSGGTVTLDVGVLVDKIKAALVDRGLGFVGNINVPVKNEQITLFQSSTLEQLGWAVKAMNTSALLLPLFALAALIGGVFLAVDRRKAILWLGGGLVLVTVLPLEGIYLAQAPFTDAVYKLGGMPSAAAIAAYQIVFRNLITAERFFAFVGLVIWVAALIAGPSKWATSLRGGFQHGLANIGPDWDFGGFGQWVFDHRTGVRGAGFVLALVVLLFAPVKSIATVLWLIVAVLVWLVLVEIFGRPRPQKAKAA